MPIVSMKDLLESGVHFGHRTQKWNPYMEPYIFAARNDIHIIDLQQTVAALEEAYEVVRDTVAGGGSVLFVGTKRQAQEIIKENAEKVGMPYVIGRWLGGTLTNWQTIRERIHELERLEGMRDRGEFELFTKKEALGMTREIERLEGRLGGIRGFQLIVSIIAQAVSEGINMRKDHEADLQAAEAEAQLPEELRDQLSDEELLGESTLAKMKQEEEETPSETDEETDEVEAEEKEEEEKSEEA